MNTMNTLCFTVASYGVRNNIIHTIEANCPGEFFTNEFCKHLREFKRHCLDEYSEITFTLPKKVKIIITTTRVDGMHLSYNVPTLPSLPDKRFQKTRWWKGLV
jgi:hypothetical protein